MFNEVLKEDFLRIFGFGVCLFSTMIKDCFYNQEKLVSNPDMSVLWSRFVFP